MYLRTYIVSKSKYHTRNNDLHWKVAWVLRQNFRYLVLSSKHNKKNLLEKRGKINKPKKTESLKHDSRKTKTSFGLQGWRQQFLQGQRVQKGHAKISQRHPLSERNRHWFAWNSGFSTKLLCGSKFRCAFLKDCETMIC